MPVTPHAIRKLPVHRSRARAARWLVFFLSVRVAAFDPSTLSPAGCHPDGISYWGGVMFANALHHGGEWLAFSGFDWGSYTNYWNNPQFDAHGYPRYLTNGLSLRTIPYGVNNDENQDVVTGQFVLEWDGAADIRYGGSYLTAKSSGPATGVLTNGRRVYQASQPFSLQVVQIQTSHPLSSIKLWLPDPADPQNRSLTNRTWHPLFLDRVRDRDWGVIRMMNMQDANANPQRDWSDRRPPAHIFMTGELHPRSPGGGSDGDRSTGIAFEQMVDLCNTTSNDLWVCVPHLATPEFVTNLARLIRFGSDGVMPYTGVVADPVYPPLSPGRRVFVEYSNEIWNNGYSFPQGNWAQEEADALGISRARFNARKFCDTWRVFQEVFGGTQRLVRVAATFTAVQDYTAQFLDEIKVHGAGLSPAVEPDVVGVTTYFGNGIQDWVHERSIGQAGTSDPWFYTTAMFTNPPRPVSLPPTDPYWSSAALERHIDEAFVEWKRRLLAGDAAEGGGPDAVGLGGGFDRWMTELARTNFSTPKPLIAYEGGPSIYTDYLDGVAPEDDGITDFMRAMNQRAPMMEVYRMHLEVARSKGLWMHMPFTLTGPWGKYGQWGHLAYSSQVPADAPKYQFMLDWFDEVATQRHVDRVSGSAPSFTTPPDLPPAEARFAFDYTINTGGGDGVPRLDVIGSLLTSGLSLDYDTNLPDRIRIHGTPAEPGFNYIMLRVVDRDGDPSWQTFTLPVVGGSGTVIESSFAGADVSFHLPWTNVLVRGHRINFSGWTNGAGAMPFAGDDGLYFTVSAPTDGSTATLAGAIQDQEYLAFRINAPSNYVINLAGALCRFGMRRLDWNASREFAIMTSAEGFTAGAALFTSDYYEADVNDFTHSFHLPSSAAYRAISGPFEMRIYGFSGQYDQKPAGLIDFKLTAATPYPVVPAAVDADGDGLSDAWEVLHFGSTQAVSGASSEDTDGDGASNYMEYLAGTDPTNHLSSFSFRPASLPGGTGFGIAWSSVSGAVYGLETTGDLLSSGPWSVVAAGLVATPPVNVYTVLPPFEARSYRVVLESLP